MGECKGFLRKKLDVEGHFPQIRSARDATGLNFLYSQAEPDLIPV